MKQHLIHIGYPKSGSTFLQEWFVQHPQLQYAPGGLGGFQNVYQVSQASAAQIPKDFLYFVTSDESLCIPKLSTGKLPIENGLEHHELGLSNIHAPDNSCSSLKALFPNAKILLITRGFEGLIKSGYSQLVRTGFRYDIAQYKLLFRLTEEKSSAGVDYTRIINTYERAFGQENMIVLPYELLRDNQTLFLRTIEQRLGLRHVACSIGRINESLSPEELYWYPRLSSLVSGFAQPLGQKAYERIFKWYVSKTIKNDFKGFIRFLNKIKNGQQTFKPEDTSEALAFIRANNEHRFAAALKHNPAYANYLSAYLLDNE